MDLTMELILKMISPNQILGNPLGHWAWAGFPFGAIVGSFLNCLIHRLPRGISILRPRSFCPHCKVALRPIDLIPVFSYFRLRGRCHSCGKPISLRYPGVELIAGLLVTLSVIRLSTPLEAIGASVLLLGLLACALIDWEHRIVPAQITTSMALLETSLRVLQGRWIDAALGIATGIAVLSSLRVTYRLVRKREGLGGGDVTLMAAVGAWLGWQGVVMTLMIGSALGVCYAIPLLVRRKVSRTSAIPFTPFLSVAAGLLTLL